MTSHARVPSSLSPYVCIPPENSLVLCTHVLGASNNWLLLRYLYAFLHEPLRHSDPLEGGGAAAKQKEDVVVIFVSWMRGFNFWKTEARRSVALDLPRLQQQGRFIFIDGSTELCLPDESSAVKGHPPSLDIAPASTIQENKVGLYHLKDTSLQTLSSTIITAISTASSTASSSSPLSSSRIILILDTPTLPLSLSPTSITAQSLTSTILTLRSHPRIHATLINLPIDDPFIDACRTAEQSGLATGSRGLARTLHMPLDVEYASFVAQCVAHARFVVGCRRLGTGWALDVSGVVRVCRGGEIEADMEVESEVEEGEWLYHIGSDGNVKVWRRGSGMDGG